MNVSLLEHWPFLLLFQSIAVSLGWLLVALGARRFSAAWLGAWWRAGFIALLALPAVSLAPPIWRVPRVSESSAIQAPNVAISSEEPPPLLGLSDDRTDHLSKVFLKLRPQMLSARNSLISLWVTGTLLVLLRAARSVRRVRRLIRDCNRVTSPAWLKDAAREAAAMRLSRSVGLLVHNRVPAPFAAGALRAVIVVPADALHWNDEQRRAVLRHELAHVARHDLVFQWLAEVAVALHWLNPLVWVARRQLLLAQERAADDVVLAAGLPGEDYATLLTDAAQQGRCLTREFVLAPMARESTLSRRVARVLDVRQRRAPVSVSTRCMVTALASVVTSAIGRTRLEAQDAVAGKSKEPTSPPATVKALDQSLTRTFRDTYRLNPSFAEHFGGTAEAAVGAFRKELEAARVILPAEVKLDLAPDKSKLTVEFGLPHLQIIQGELRHTLRENGWWRMPIKVEQQATDQELVALTNQVEELQRRARESKVEVEKIRVKDQIIDPDPESFLSAPTTFDWNILDLEKKLKDKAQDVANLKAQLAQVMKMKPEELKEVMRTLKIDDPIMERTLAALNEAKSDEAKLTNSGLGEKHPKVLGLHAQKAEISRQLYDFLATVQQSRTTLLQIEEGVLATLQQKLDEAKTNQIEDKNKVGAYIDAKARYLQDEKVFEAAKEKLSFKRAELDID